MSNTPHGPIPGYPVPPPPAPPPYPPPDVASPERERWGAGLPPDLVYPWDAPPPQAERRRRIPFGRLATLLAVLLALAVGVRSLVFLSAVSTEPLWSAHLWPLADERRANVLILGYGGQGHDGAYLTDSLLLLHSDLASGQSAQINVPRDLWVQIPPDSGRYAKINSAYAYGLGDDNDQRAGGQLITTKVSQVTGLPTNRWVTIDFRGFRALVDALGGVDIEVERAFNSRYPANDDPAIDPGWTTVSFAAGPQHMDSETAIRYARARYADTPEEASDFARAQRQSRLVAAIAARLKRPTVWPRIFAVMDALQPALRTNLAPVDLPILFLRANLAGATRVRLDDSNVLVNDTSGDGQAILVPRNDDYGLIARYISEQIAAR
jgi:LCP family protein required for cell wall assembly